MDKPFVQPGSVTYNGSFRRENGKSANIEIVSYQNQPITGHGRLLVEGKIDVKFNKFGNPIYRILADNITPFDEAGHVNRLELTLLADAPLRNREKTSRYRCYHIKPGRGAFPVDIAARSASGIELDSLRENERLSVQGGMELWYNGLLQRTQFTVLLTRLEKITRIIHTPRESEAMARLMAFLAEPIGYRGARKFSSLSELDAEGDRYLTKAQMEKIRLLVALADDLAEAETKPEGSVLCP